ncbi:2-oxoacid:ferredoxin oxidoreductase subunit gamma [candidate division GN15 bacterium]|nr:2-oxoacid:ferredoxin oxidoreductase subunit gamma [candidate division GN15 bacterium]
MRLSGSGGQGMILASVIMSEAIGASDQRNVVQSQSYGPEARGGASKADVVISENEIYYPKAMNLDLLLAMTQESLDAYYGQLKDDGLLIVDTTLVTDIKAEKYYGLPFTRLAREEAGHIMVANVIALATIASLTNIVTREKLTEAVLKRAPKRAADKNLKAIEIGYAEAEKLK